ncbi:ribonuclease III [Patescibacteria group bacterium]|nr:ribonuclease III [Patescibacteria group bacterium]MBU4162367.1 ribonuclease III [Patescibacteria group bacterium]
MEKFSELEKKLNISFKDKGLLAQAFCHRSYLNENPDFGTGHNERLEFLGDAVLELAVSERIFLDYPNEGEGVLTSWRAALVNSKSLSKLARELDFNDFLLLSKGERKERGRARQEILANTFEAFTGALYLDQGYKICKNFIEEHLIVKLPSILANHEFVDHKSRFQEMAQEKEKITPHYEVLKEWGPDHSKNFIAGIFLGEKLIAQGEGMSKQEAEENAASEGLKVKKWGKH